MKRGKPGWRKTCNAEQFLADLRDYAALLDRYPNVVGATVFTLGQVGVRWRDFDCGSLWPRVVAEQATPAPPPPAPPVVVPPVTPPPTLDVAELRALARNLKSQLDGADDALRAAYITWDKIAGILG